MAHSWIDRFIMGYLEENRKREPDNPGEEGFDDDDLAAIAGDLCDLGEINHQRRS